MKISQNCLELIKKWEGLSLEAYLDPVDIPTIGYGTIRYPNGQKVQMGDTITEQEAEAFLQLECDEVAEKVSKLVSGISLNQNQFDALVSLCYNIGTGAFEDSTLLRELKANNFANAAKEFDRWVKGTKNGQLVTLPGLVNRRKEERALFEKSGGQATPIDTETSPQDKVTWLEGYRDGEKNVIVARNGSEVIEILTLESHLKEDLIAVLQQYKNALNFHFAPNGKTIPSGDRIAVATKEKSILKVIDPPPLSRLLVLDTEGSDVKKLQERLNDLGYDAGEVDGIFGKKTDTAVKEFQADYFGVAEADGKVGPITWKKLWGDVSPTLPPPTTPVPGKNYLGLTKTQRKDGYGCYVLNLQYFKDGEFKDAIEVCSGQPKKQFFRIGRKSIAGSAEPLPEGKWFIHDIRWAGGKDNYDGKIHASGIGPVTIPLDYVGPDKTGRSAIEIHIDWNRKQFPGTVGCIGVYTKADYKRLVSWLRDTDPRDLFVDWGLGTCPKP